VGPVAQAETPTPEAARVDASPVVPPRLVTPAPPVYPEAALAEGLTGEVSLLVDVSTEGLVTEARFEAGPAIFTEAALDAAKRLRFAPATQDGRAVAVTTRVHFEFSPPSALALAHVHAHDHAAEEIVVHASYPDLGGTRARTTLDEAHLEAHAGDDLAETLSEVPGVTLAGGTTDAAKPIIRGHQERRLLVLYDGIRHESQKWGADHATEIDPFSAGQISVIRGAAGARYGPDAIGGVVLVAPPPFRTEPGVGGKALTAFSSNGRRPYGAARLDLVPAGRDALTVRVEGNYARGASLSAPDYVLGNTSSEQWNGGLAAGWRWDSGQLRLGWHHYDFRAGVYYGVKHGTPSDLETQLTAERPVTAHLWSTTYAIDRPYQAVTHDVVSAHLVDTGDLGSVELTYAYQHNHREEFDQVRGDNESAQYDFTLRTHSLDTLLEHPGARLGDATLSGGLGLQGLFQENIYAGLSLIPNFRGLSGGVFAFERLSWYGVDLEAGARYDHLDRTAFMTRLVYGQHERRGTLSEAECTVEDDGDASCPASYDAGTVSLGALIHVVPDTLDLKLDLSSASRFPNVDELYLIGSAPTFPVYALGNPSLGIETSWSGSTTLGLRLPWLTAEASAYGSWITDYVYFSPQRNADGSLHYDVTVRGTFPTYEYQPIDAVVSGLDGGFELNPDGRLGLDAGGALVRAVHAETGEQLIGTPADHLRLSAQLRPGPAGPLRETVLSVSSELVAQQTRTEVDADFAPPPPGYVLLGAGVQTELELKGRDLRIALHAHNLLDTAYREYTSLLRYYGDQPGRDVRLRVGVDL